MTEEAYEELKCCPGQFDWVAAEDELAKELSFRQDQQLKELEMHHAAE